MAIRQGDMNAIETGRREPGAEAFLTARARGAGDSTLRSYANHLGIVRRMSPKPLLEMSRTEAERVAAKLSRRRSGYSLSITMRMFYAYHFGRHDPRTRAFLLEKKQRRIPRPNLLTIEDVNRMMEAMDLYRDKAFIALLWESGARASEVLALNLEDVAKPNGYWEATFRKSKVIGEENTRILTAAGEVLEAWLKAYPFPRSETAPLFPSYDKYGRRLTYHGARYVVLQAAKAAGVEKPVNLHAFRHGRATDLQRRGVPDGKVKRFMGWKPDSTMLGRYSHLVDEDVSNAILEAHGLRPLERQEIPVLKVPANGLAMPPGVVSQVITPRELSDLLEDPNVARFVQLLAAARQPPQA